MIILLFLIYRAPILAVIPLLTVFISVKIAVLILSLLAEADVIRLFSGIEVYVTVVLYGAGVDYCMFLIARYRRSSITGQASTRPSPSRSAAWDTPWPPVPAR